MTTTLFREAGEALYGSRWQSDMARALDVSDRTVRRWAAGSHDVSPGAWVDLRMLLKSRGLAIAAVRCKLRRRGRAASSVAPHQQ